MATLCVAKSDPLLDEFHTSSTRRPKNVTSAIAFDISLNFMRDCEDYPKIDAGTGEPIPERVDECWIIPAMVKMPGGGDRFVYCAMSPCAGRFNLGWLDGDVVMFVGASGARSKRRVWFQIPLR